MLWAEHASIPDARKPNFKVVMSPELDPQRANPPIEGGAMSEANTAHGAHRDGVLSEERVERKCQHARIEARAAARNTARGERIQRPHASIRRLKARKIRKPGKAGKRVD